jgi:hypothetical protein
MKGTVAVIVFIMLAPLAHADVLELKAGQRIEGTFKEAVDGKVSIEVGDQTITFDQEKVRSILFDNLPAPVVTAPVATAPVASPAPAPTPPPALRIDPVSEASAVLAPLKTLRSIAQAGTNYRDYAQRVADTKPTVDTYVSEGEASPIKAAIGEAMDYYAFAATAWKASLSWAGYDEYIQIGSNPLVAKCPKLEEEIKQSQQVRAAISSGRKPREVHLAEGVVIANHGTAQLWACASDRISEAERLLTLEPDPAAR